MAKPDTRQAQGNQKTKCEYSGCAVMFSINSQRRQHVRKHHRPIIHCCIPGCEWTTRRPRRLRVHLDDAHRIEGISKPSSHLALGSSSLTQVTASTNRTLLSEFRTATAQLLVSSNHCKQLYALGPSPKYFCRFINRHLASSPDANTSLKSIPTTLPIPVDPTFMSQAPPGVSESHAALISEEAPSPEHIPIPNSSVTWRMRAQATRCRVFRPCRVRRRELRPTAHTPPAGLPSNHQGSVMESTPGSYASRQDNPTASTQ